MKFTHGIWENREHTSIHNAVEVAHVSEPKPGSLRALCTTRHVTHRGNTLNRPTITVSLRAAAPDIISCSATHFRGAKTTEPRFELFPGDPSTNSSLKAEPVVHDESINTSTLPSLGLSAVLQKNPSAFRINFVSAATGASLTGVGFQGVQYIVGPPGQVRPSPLDATTVIGDPYTRTSASRNNKPYMSVALDLQVGELVYGLGERFGPLTKNGQDIDLWNEDAGTCTPYSTSTHTRPPCASPTPHFHLTSQNSGAYRADAPRLQPTRMSPSI